MVLISNVISLAIALVYLLTDGAGGRGLGARAAGPDERARPSGPPPALHLHRQDVRTHAIPWMKSLLFVGHLI